MWGRGDVSSPTTGEQSAFRRADAQPSRPDQAPRWTISSENGGHPRSASPPSRVAPAEVLQPRRRREANTPRRFVGQVLEMGDVRLEPTTHAV